MALDLPYACQIAVTAKATKRDDGQRERSNPDRLADLCRLLLQWRWSQDLLSTVSLAGQAKQ